MSGRKLTYENIVSKISKICQKQNIILVLNDPDVSKDNGAAFGKNEIHLGSEYSSNYIFMAIFFHEYGHIVLQRRKSYKYSRFPIFREEVLAWTLAMEYQLKHFNRHFTRSQGKFMLECLQTYSKQHYIFRKSYPRDVEEDEDED